jgi:hypothetical protein
MHAARYDLTAVPFLDQEESAATWIVASAERSS